MAVAVGSATMMVRSLLQQQAEEELTTEAQRATEGRSDASLASTSPKQSLGEVTCLHTTT